MLRKNKDGVWRPLYRMPLQYLFHQLNTFFMLHLVFNHGMQQEIHKCKHYRYFFIREAILATEFIIHEMEVQN